MRENMDIVLKVDGKEIDRLPCVEEPEIIMRGMCGPWREGLVPEGSFSTEIFGERLAAFITEYVIYHANEGCKGMHDYQMSGTFELDEEIFNIYSSKYPISTITWEIEGLEPVPETDEEDED